jgi:nitrate reductase NapAB chaperone NapD
MIYSGSVVFIEPENLKLVQDIINGFSELEIHAVSEDKRQIIVSIETDSDTALDEVSRRLKSYDEIIDIGHHVMHFEEEVDKILEGKVVPDLHAFQRSNRRDKHPLETEEA